jgi:hypothetical protein
MTSKPFPMRCISSSTEARRSLTPPSNELPNSPTAKHIAVQRARVNAEGAKNAGEDPSQN